MAIWLEFVWRVALIIPVLVAISLIVGTRTVGEIRVLDFLFVAILASMAANAMTSLDTLLLGTIIAMAALTAAYWALLRFGMTSTRFRRLSTAGPTALIRNGTIDADAMRRSHIDLDKLLAMLREKDVFDPAEVESAVLETSGKLSVLTKAQADRQSHAIVIDGTVDDRELGEAGKTRAWLSEELRRRRLNLANVLLAAYSRKGELYIAEKPAPAVGTKGDGGAAGGAPRPRRTI
ncbi:MAG: DUF421 domain-containing protein [Chloroflexota bacterium]